MACGTQVVPGYKEFNAKMEQHIGKDPALETKISYELSKSGDTQVTNTVETYRKAKNKHFKNLEGSDILDYGSGLGLAAKELGLDSFEPYAKGVNTPTYTNPSQINKKYEGIISNAVLNVLPMKQRVEAVRTIGDSLAVGGKAVVMVRSPGFIKSLKDPASYEDGVITKGKGTFQKGFNRKELKDFVNSVLGKNFLVTDTSVGDVGILITKLRETEEVESSEDVREDDSPMDAYRDVGMSPGDFI